MRKSIYIMKLLLSFSLLSFGYRQYLLEEFFIDVIPTDGNCVHSRCVCTILANERSRRRSF